MLLHGCSMSALSGKHDGFSVLVSSRQILSGALLFVMLFGIDAHPSSRSVATVLHVEFRPSLELRLH